MCSRRWECFCCPLATRTLRRSIVSPTEQVQPQSEVELRPQLQLSPPVKRLQKRSDLGMCNIQY